MTLDIILVVLVVLLFRELVKTKSELSEIKEYVKKIAEKE